MPSTSLPASDGVRYQPISEYALLSDCRSTALVDRHGSIDWACLRRFDRGSSFARLLDHDRGGFFRIRPTQPLVEVRRRYLPGTMAVETTMRTAEGTVRLVDAMAMADGGADDDTGRLVRLVECTDGAVGVEVVIEPRFDYGGTRPLLRAHADGAWSAVGGDDALVFRTSGVTLDVDDAAAHRLSGRARLAASDELAIVVTFQAAHRLDPAGAASDHRRLLDETVAWWRRWSAATVVEGPHAALVERSALVLKALCCAPTGAIIAAPTTSLPEVVGGTANWDYRFCWIRDAALTLDALSSVGHDEVAQGFRSFVMRSAAGHADELQVMYGAYGEHRLPELELDLEGWQCSAPVRCGNAAAGQVQLDVYGHLLAAVHLWHQRHHDIDDDEWAFLCSVVDLAAASWQRPDAGIWERRGAPQQFVHSKAMVWLALDCGIRLVDEHGLHAAHVDDWRAAQDAIRHAIETRGVDPDRGNFVVSFGSVDVDASLLKLALIGFVAADDPRMVTTVERITEDLTDTAGLVRRYRQHDEPTAGEGSFLLCSLWMVEVLALQGRLDDARALFERVVAVGNDVGLFAEEWDAERHELLGNFPQAFTHLGLVSAARRLWECDRERGGRR